MDVMQIVAVGIVGAVLAITVRKQNPAIGMVISIASCLLILFSLLPAFAAAVNMLNRLGELAGSGYIPIILKIIGIAYISEFGAGICEDAGESAIASKIEMGGKILIMLVSIPIIYDLIELILQTLPA